MPSSPSMGFSVWSKPTPRPVNPLGGDTINRRAVCGRTACTVRRGEGPKPIGPSYPYQDVVSLAVEDLVRLVPEVLETRERWRGLKMLPSEMMDFARKALPMRFD